MNIPKEFSGEVHFSYNMKYGFLQTSPDDWGKETNAERVYLGSTIVSIHFDDVRQAAADAIDQQIEAVRAELTNRIAILQGQKASLLALECDQ